MKILRLALKEAKWRFTWIQAVAERITAMLPTEQMLVMVHGTILQLPMVTGSKYLSMGWRDSLKLLTVDRLIRPRTHLCPWVWEEYFLINGAILTDPLTISVSTAQRSTQLRFHPCTIQVREILVGRHRPISHRIASLDGRTSPSTGEMQSVHTKNHRYCPTIRIREKKWSNWITVNP